MSRDDEGSGQDLAKLVLAIAQSEKIRAEARQIDRSSATDRIVRVGRVALLATATFVLLYLVIRHPWLLERRFPVLAVLGGVFQIGKVSM